MNKHKFTIKGYARFYRSLPRFYQEIDDAYALKFMYSLHLAANSAYRRKNPDKGITEYTEKDFYPLILEKDVKPYRTEVQLYRALELLKESLSGDGLNDSQTTLISDLINLMLDLESRFYKAFGIAITDKRTVYSLCEKSLVANNDEPRVCLRSEWRRIAII